MKATATARIAGVIGWPACHSLSPLIHGYWLERLNIDGVYIPLPVTPERFGEAIRGISALGFAGCNITAPHKENALRAMDEVHPLARRVGAVNTVVVRDDHSFYGLNTDVAGFMDNLTAGCPRWDPKAGAAVVISAGGAARAVCVGLLDAGAPEIRLVNRTREKAERLAADIGGAITVYDWNERHDCLDGANLLVNSGSLGRADMPPVDLVLDALPAAALVTDLNYVPLMTDILERAQLRGNPIVDGLGMLLYQAVPGFAAWFGQKPVVSEELRRLALAGYPRP